jgi:hypothetical protein
VGNRRPNGSSTLDDWKHHKIMKISDLASRFRCPVLSYDTTAPPASKAFGVPLAGLRDRPGSLFPEKRGHFHEPEGRLHPARVSEIQPPAAGRRPGTIRSWCIGQTGVKYGYCRSSSRFGRQPLGHFEIGRFGLPLEVKGWAS